MLITKDHKELKERHAMQSIECLSFFVIFEIFRGQPFVRSKQRRRRSFYR